MGLAASLTSLPLPLPRSRLLVLVVGLVVVAGAGAPACAPREGVRSASPIDAVAAAGMTASELASSKPDDAVLGTKLQVVGDRATYLACTAEDSCGGRPVDLPASAVTAVKVIGRTRPAREDGTLGDETDVLRITVARSGTTSRGGVASDPHRGLVVGGTTTSR